MNTFQTLLLLCPFVFFAGFVDSISGGGGLISLPAYLFVGLPVHISYGTNKFAMTMGTALSAAKFLKSKKLHLKSALISAIFALLGSFFGARLVLYLSENYLKYCLLILLPVVSLFLLFNRNFGTEKSPDFKENKRLYFLSGLCGLLCGAYDGFFGPGTGTFLILLFTSVLGMDLITASGNAKIVNLASNISALTVYLLHGKVMFAIGIPAALCAVAGNYFGARLALHKGAKVIRPIMLLVVCLLFFRVIADLL